jgi:hypothetical protein
MWSPILFSMSALSRVIETAGTPVSVMQVPDNLEDAAEA